jgi:hypothetical protein
MSKAPEIEAAFRERGTVRGGLLLLRADDAIALTNAAREAGIAVLGVDAFILGPGITQPVMEHSRDLSAQSSATDSWTSAIDFIQRQPEHLYFEVVLN